MPTADSAASIATLLTHADLTHSSKTSSSSSGSPVLRLVQEANAKGYETVCIPLTTQRWKARWEDMCLAPSPSSSSTAGMTDKAKKRESRRDSRAIHLQQRDMRAEKRAEQWRLRPVFEKDEVTITQLEEAEGVTAIISEWLELDSPDDWIRNDAETALQQELSYASYLNIQSVILPPPRRENRAYVSSYARIINSCLAKVPSYMSFSIRLPIYHKESTTLSALRSSSSLGSNPPLSPSPSQTSFFSRGQALDPFRNTSPSPTITTLSRGMLPEAIEGGELDANWEMWDVVRSMCDYNTRLTLALDLTPPLPTTIGVLHKWSAEAVKYIVIPASTFLTNTKGYPVLPKPTQAFIKDSVTHNPIFILSGVEAGLHSRGGESAYAQYIRHLEKTSPSVLASQKPGTVENFAQGYQDFLQAPLQPLMDNLQSFTYETFEQCRVKYPHYEEAIYNALCDWPGDDIIIMCVAGAGRGPLVSRALSAIERSGREAFVYAVEKNPNAFVTLQHRKQREWGDKVKLLFGDMRYVEVPEKVDILISELLGSFGDNELSPECLDGATRFLKPDAISIPSSYTAHIAPLSSSKLYNEARVVKDPRHMETPYVVMFQSVNILSDEEGAGRIQECWEFEHPRRDVVVSENGLTLTNTHNARSATLNFHIPHAGVLHGLAGYFEAVLYGNIGLSIHPERKDEISKDMISWFPLFFPFKEPLYLPSNCELEVSIWRMTNEKQIWYEWHAESFLSVNGAPLRQRDRSPPAAAAFEGGMFTPHSSSSAPLMSPLIDAVDPPSINLRQDREESCNRVKIGQTALHNPGGRSSWIGL